MLGVGGGQYRPFWFILITWINVEFLSLLFLLLFSVSYVCMYWVGAGPYKPGSELMVQQTIIGFQSTQDKLCPVKTEIKFNKKTLFIYLIISHYIYRACMKWKRWLDLFKGFIYISHLIWFSYSSKILFTRPQHTMRNQLVKEPWQNKIADKLKLNSINEW